MITEIDLQNAGLDTSDRPSHDPRQLRKALNVVPTGGSIRTSPGYFPIHDQVYRNGTDSKVAIFANTFDEIDSDAVFIRATKQSKITGSANSTVANCLNVAAATFKPEHVGCYVQNTTDSTTATVTRFISSTRVQLSSNIFTSGENFSLHEIGDTIASSFYSNPNAAAYADGTLVGEIGDVDDLEFVPIQDRILVLSGAERGNVVHGNTFRPLGISECFDNNSLSYTVTGAGNKTGLYKWALTFFDESTFRESPPLYIENSDRTDGFFSLTSNKLEFNEATLPTNTTDTWTHYKLWCKKSEWQAYKFVVSMEKTASSLEDNVVDNTLIPRESLVENRYVPAGFSRGVRWLNRAILWRKFSLSIDGNGSTSGISVENGSKEVTLSGTTTGEWMSGSKLYMSSDGGSLTKGFDIQYVKDSTTLVLYSKWDGDSISFGDGRIVPSPNRLTICMESYANCEFTSPWHIYDINPDDGDEIVTCSVIGETLYVIKKKSVWSVNYVNITDQVAAEIPNVILDVKPVVMGDGCVGSRAITVADDGAIYWLSVDGLVSFDGHNMRQVSKTDKVDVTQYIRWQTASDLADVTISFNSAWKCVEIFGLKREDGSDASLRYFTIDGRWFEADAVPSNTVLESVGMKKYVEPVVVPEKMYIPSDSYWINDGSSIYTLNIDDGASASPALFARFVTDDFAGLWPVSVAFDGSFNPIFLMTQQSVGAMPAAGYDRTTFIQKYNASDGTELWASEFDLYTDALDYIKTVIQAANPTYTFSSDETNIHPNVGNGEIARYGNNLFAVTTFGTRWSDAPNTYRFFHTVIICLDVSDGTVNWRNNFTINASGTDPINHNPTGMATTGPICVDTDGNLWVAYDALYQQGTHAGSTYMGEDTEGRIAKVSSVDGTPTHYNVSTTIGEKVHIRSMSYSPYGYIVCTALYQDTIGDINGGTIKHGVVVFNASDMSVAVSEFETSPDTPYASYDGYAIGSPNSPGGSSGFESTGAMCTGWEQALLRNGVARSNQYILVSSGTRLWQIDFSGPTITKDLVDVGEDKTDHRITRTTMDSQGRFYVIRYRNSCSSASGGDQITVGSASTPDPVIVVTRYDPQTGDEVWSTTHDFGSIFGTSQHGSSPSSWNATFSTNFFAGWTNSHQDVQRANTYGAKVTGTTTSASANKLIDSGANFHAGLLSGVVTNTSIGPYQSQCTGLGTNKLIDSGASFDSKFIKAGAVVQNTTQVTSATVVSVDSATQITLDSDIFDNIGDFYLIPLGQLDVVCNVTGRDSATQLSLDEDKFNSGEDYSIGGQTTGTVGKKSCQFLIV